MHRRLLPLVVLLSACAPAQGVTESWAKQIFAPSPETLEAGCSLGLARTFRRPNASVGKLRIESTTSGRTIEFHSAPSQLYSTCGQFGSLIEPEDRDAYLASDSYRSASQAARAYVIVEGNDVRADQTQVRLSLNSDTGRALLEIEPRAASGVVKLVRFEFGTIPAQQRPLLDSVSSFTVDLNVGATSEKFLVDPSRYTALGKVEG
jgi:hypothetical protein